MRLHPDDLKANLRGRNAYAPMRDHDFLVDDALDYIVSLEAQLAEKTLSPQDQRDLDIMRFMEKQKFTRWVGYTTPDGYVHAPVFARDSFRAEAGYYMDKAIEYGYYKP